MPTSETIDYAEATEYAELAVIDDPAVAAALVDPKRSQVLAALAEPGSATTVAATLGLTRQQVNYHLRALEAQGLVVQVGTRQRRGLTERVVRAAARGYVVSPSVLGALSADPRRMDRLSADYLVALAARAVREVGSLLRSAAKAGKQLPTLSLDVDLRFASPADRAAFTAELTESLRTLASKYHDERSSDGRWHRVLVGAYPKPHEEER